MSDDEKSSIGSAARPLQATKGELGGIKNQMDPEYVLAEANRKLDLIQKNDNLTDSVKEKLSVDLRNQKKMFEQLQKANAVNKQDKN